MKNTKITVPKVKTRVTWGFNPTNRVKPSKKIYSRNKLKNLSL